MVVIWLKTVVLQYCAALFNRWPPLKPIRYLHGDHSAWAAGVQGPQVAADALVVTTLVPPEDKVVQGQGDDVARARISHRGPVPSLIGHTD